MSASRPNRAPACSISRPMCPARAARPASPRSTSCRPTRRRSAPSPRAVEAYHGVADRLHDYPDGTVRTLREAIGRAFGLDPARIVCGAGSDDLINLLARAYLADGDEAIYTTHGFPDLSDRDSRRRREAGGRRGARLHGPTSTAILPGGDAQDQDRVQSPIRTTRRHLCAFDEGPPPATADWPPHVLLVLDAPMPNMSAQRTTRPHRAGGDLAECVVMLRTFSKIHGLAALRLGWMYGPAHIVEVINRSAVRSTSIRRRLRPASRRSRTQRIRTLARAQYALAAG